MKVILFMEPLSTRLRPDAKLKVKRYIAIPPGAKTEKQW